MLFICPLKNSVLALSKFHIFHFIGCYFYYQVFSDVDLEPILRRFKIVTPAELGPAPPRPADCEPEAGGEWGEGLNLSLYYRQHFNRQKGLLNLRILPRCFLYTASQITDLS